MQKSTLLKHYALFVVVLLTLSLFVLFNNTSALEYSSNTNIQFTFNPTLSINISGNLTIDNLSPGTYSDSNIVDVNVSTNTVAGYMLTATVGNSSGSGNNSTNLIHSTYNDHKFSSITSNKADLSSFSDNTWGYSYSTNNGTNWISGSIGYTNPGYNGLPLDTNSAASELGKGGTTLVDTYSSANSSNIKFKIGAKASSTQAAGTYTNTINFYAVSKVPPVSISDAFVAANKTKTPSGYYKMQDMSASICSMVQTIDEDSQTELVDIRDGKTYWVAKLQDGNCWMTQNLDLNLDSSVALTSNDTDLVQYGTSTGYVDGYSCSNSDPACAGGVITWRPERNTIDAVTTESTSIASIPDYVGVTNIPYSVDPGNWYWYGQYYNSGNCPSAETTSPINIGCDYISKRTKDNNRTDVTNNWATYFSTTQYNINGTHGHVGNYYNWASSIASNNASVYTTDTSDDTSSNPQNSICPSGWRLPVTTAYASSSPYAAGDNEFYNLAYYYGTPTRNSDAKLITKPLYFTRTGDVYSNSLHGAGYYGYYWSSMVVDGTYAYALYFDDDYIDPLYAIHRSVAKPVRCLAQRDSASTISGLTYLQDFVSLSGSELTSVKNSMANDTNYTLTDKRDGNEYTVKKINDQIWMTQNLRITGVIPANGSNFTGTEFNVSQYSLDANDGSYANHCDATNGYNYACAKDSGDTTTGVWYNYYAATAGTIATDSNADRATQDICPAGWHLPSGPNTTANTDVNRLIGNTASGLQPITAGITAFDTAIGGAYANGSIIYGYVGSWWSNSVINAQKRYIMTFSSNSNQFRGDNTSIRSAGVFLRCVTE